jgi:hypothetical protein
MDEGKKKRKKHAQIEHVLVDIDADVNINNINDLVFHLQERVHLHHLFPKDINSTLLLRRNDDRGGSMHGTAAARPVRCAPVFPQLRCRRHHNGRLRVRVFGSP